MCAQVRGLRDSPVEIPANGTVGGVERVDVGVFNRRQRAGVLRVPAVRGVGCDRQEPSIKISSCGCAHAHRNPASRWPGNGAVSGVVDCVQHVRHSSG